MGSLEKALHAVQIETRGPISCCKAERVTAGHAGFGGCARSVGAAVSTASSLGLKVDDAVVLNNSNRLAVRLVPCDVLARVGVAAHQVAQFEFEVELARRLATTRCPVANLEPRIEPLVYDWDGFVVTLWTYYEPAPQPRSPPPSTPTLLERLHAGFLTLDIAAPHFSDRVAQAQRLVASPDHTPALGDADRELLSDALRVRSRAILDHGTAQQLLHGEPHPGNVLSTTNGALFS